MGTPRVASASDSLVALVNRDRAAHGLKPLHVSAYLTGAAVRHNNAMARAGNIYHTPDLGNAICCWIALGENVGEGPVNSANSPEPETIEYAFMHSAEHRRNILEPLFTEIGVAVTERGDTCYVTEEFRLPNHQHPVSPMGPVVHHVIAKPPPQTVEMLLRMLAMDE